MEAPAGLEKEKDKQHGRIGQIHLTMERKVEKEKVVERKAEKEKEKDKEKARKEKVKEKVEKAKERTTERTTTKVIGLATKKILNLPITILTTGTHGMKKSGMKNLKLSTLTCSPSHRNHSTASSSSLQEDGSQVRWERELLLSLVCRTSAA